MRNLPFHTSTASDTIMFNSFQTQNSDRQKASEAHKGKDRHVAVTRQMLAKLQEKKEARLRKDEYLDLSAIKKINKKIRSLT